MGKLSSSDAELLQKKGILSKKTTGQMQKEGLVSTRTRNTAKYMKTADGKWVSPELFFRGKKSSKNSNKMDDFRNDFNKLVKKYCTTKSK